MLLWSLPNIVTHGNGELFSIPVASVTLGGWQTGPPRRGYSTPARINRTVITESGPKECKKSFRFVSLQNSSLARFHCGKVSNRVKLFHGKCGDLNAFGMSGRRVETFPVGQYTNNPPISGRSFPSPGQWVEVFSS